MTKATVLVHRTMSLDGFIAEPGDAMHWIFEHSAPDDVEEIIRATGAILAGRRSYDVGEHDTGKASQGPYGGAWSGPIFVLTHRPPQAAHDPAISFLAGDIRAAVGTARQAAAGKKVEIFGADVARQCFEHGLVDEVLVHVAPVLLGAGVPFYDGAEVGRVDLEPISTKQSGSITTLHYRVRH